MIRLLAVAILAMALLPASAEAAKFRFGGRSHATPTSQGHRDGSHLVATPALRSGRAESAAASQPLRSATPTTIAAANATDLRSTQPAEPQIWCRSQTVIGGFCVMN